jgi:hypothetical protein
LAYLASIGSTAGGSGEAVSATAFEISFVSNYDI